MFTGTGLASLIIVGLLFTPLGDKYVILYYCFGVLQFFALFMCLFVFKQIKFEPDWNAILNDGEAELDTEG